MRNIVAAVINLWDPIGLFPFAPQDEYRKEIDAITSFVNIAKNTYDVSVEIQNVFRNSFGDDVFTKNLPECMVIAESIMNKIANNVD